MRGVGGVRGIGVWGERCWGVRDIWNERYSGEGIWGEVC